MALKCQRQRGTPINLVILLRGLLSCDHADIEPCTNHRYSLRASTQLFERRLCDSSDSTRRRLLWNAISRVRIWRQKVTVVVRLACRGRGSVPLQSVGLAGNRCQ
ncbi:hypothetical protein EDD17DRAFT_1548850 [Pisolithus thermaeus]|nr:hypothetical protein EDD17DRAFT_1548850 [Pisolithus thermaeus]